eukprot:31529-Pelagococcus_subviridis.AAC.3
MQNTHAMFKMFKMQDATKKSFVRARSPLHSVNSRKCSDDLASNPSLLCSQRSKLLLAILNPFMATRHTRTIRFARRRQTSVDLAGSLSRNLARCRAFETFTPLAAEAFAMSGVDFAASRRASRRTGADAKLRARRGAHAAARAGAVGKRCISEKTNRLDGDDGIGRRATAAHRATAVRAATRDGDASARTSDTIIARARWVLADAW